MRKSHTTALLACTVSLGLALTACGGNTTSSSSSSAAGGAGTQSAGPADSAITDAATKAAQAAGAAVSLDVKTVGFVNYGATGLAAQRSQAAAEAAGKALGWKVVSCDGQGVPQQQASCASNLLNQNVDALLVNTIAQSTITATLAQAKAKGVPVINVGGDAGQKDQVTASYYPPEDEMGKALAEYVKTTLSSGGDLLVQTFPADFAKTRVGALGSTIQGSNIKIGSTFDADASNLVPGTQASVAAKLNSDPNIKGIWITFSSAELGAYQALQVKYPGKTYPDRPLLVTFYANLPAIDMIRKGQLDAASEDSLEWCEWVAMDQLAEYFARQKAPSTEPQPDYGPDLDFWRPVVVTKDNLPAEGSLSTPPVDFVGFFTTKWKTEFSNLASN